MATSLLYVNDVKPIAFLNHHDILKKYLDTSTLFHLKQSFVPPINILVPWYKAINAYSKAQSRFTRDTRKRC